MVAMHATGQSDRLSRVYLKGGRWALWFTLFVATPLMVYGREIVNLWVGSEFESAGLVMCLLLLSFPLGQGCRLMFPIADATAKIRQLSLRLFSMSIFNLGLAIYLVGVLDMGAMGSGIGAAVSVTLFYPLLLWPLGLKIANVSLSMWLKKTILPGLLPAAVSVAVLLGMRALLPFDSWPQMILGLIAGSLAYVATLWFGCLQEEDLADFRKLLLGVVRLPFVPSGVTRFIGGGDNRA
jgi:O-antigen/teichoic acid export membrane protein